MSTFFLEGMIEGHASPRWKNPQTKDERVLNSELSVKRAEEVQLFLQEILHRKFTAKDLAVNSNLECSQKDHFDKFSVPSVGQGDVITTIESGGNEGANHPNLRRVDITLMLTQQLSEHAEVSSAVTIPQQCEDRATREWAIRIIGSAGAGHAGLGGVVAVGEIMNRKTGDIAEGLFLGIGAGVGATIPGKPVKDKPPWTNFLTNQRVVFEHFDGTMSRFTSIGISVLIGYAASFISFPLYVRESISVGGVQLGPFGADASVNIGTWVFTSDKPLPKCIPEHQKEIINQEPVTFQIQDTLQHSVFFDTERHNISDKELIRLEEFVDTIVFNVV